MSEPIKPQRLAEAIARHLEDMILEGVLRPGEKLHAERDLAGRLSVSRPSLRDALALLEAKGLLVSTKSGTFVARFLGPLSAPLAALFGRNDERVLADYFEYRLTMEGEAARLAAARATDVDLAAIRTQLALIEQAHAAGDPARETDVDVDLHGLVYEAAHNVVLLHFMRAMAEMLRKGIFYSREQLYQRPGVREALKAQHVALGQAILARDPALAEKVARDHIQYTFDTIEAIRRDELRRAASLRRVDRRDLVAE